MTDITIPPEALDAVARVLCIADGRDPDQLVYLPVASGERPKRVENWYAYIETARAACLAMLEAWPHKWHVKTPYYDQRIILPLPQEKTND